MKALVVLLLTSIFSHCLVTDRQIPISSKDLPSEPYPFHVENKTFENYVDHFSNPLLKGKFKQIYYQVEDYWDHKAGPVILHLCGENECTFPYFRLFPLQITEKFKGLYIALEHRYYGISQPMPDWSLKNLEYLTHEQTFADYAYFIESQNVEYSKKYGYTPKWIIIGGSYAGALSAWFRLKYPHLVVGALSSSGVVTPLLDFWQFDKQISEDYHEGGEKCYNIIKYYHEVVEQRLLKSSETERKKFLQLFSDDTEISNDEFWFYFSDMSALFPQYSNRKYICQVLIQLNQTNLPIEIQLQKYAEEGKNFGTLVEDYTYKKIRSEKIVPGDLVRQWTYQYCTAYAWFQTAYKANPLRYVGMDLDYWSRFCKGGFGTLMMPRVNHTAAMFGADLIAERASNIFFTQSRNDPWRWTGINSPVPNNDKIEVGVMDCEDCGHCRELYTPKEDDPAEVKEMRQRIVKVMEKWLQ